jgi:hypothetical protein
MDNLVRDRFGKKRNPESSWRDSYPVTEGLEYFCVTYSEKFIIGLCEQDPNRKNPQFLRALIKNIADYLSVFFARIGRFENRNAARKYLFGALFDDFDFIQTLLKSQARKRADKMAKEKDIRTSKYVSPGKRKRRDKSRAMADSQTIEDVNEMFREVQSVRTSKRSITRFNRRRSVTISVTTFNRRAR